jgi:hypothetical protein
MTVTAERIAAMDAANAAIEEKRERVKIATTKADRARAAHQKAEQQLLEAQKTLRQAQLSADDL